MSEYFEEQNEEIMEENENTVKHISVLNWMGTIILSVIPGVNILFLLGSAIFARSKSKKTYAGACLILILVFLVLVCAAWFVFGENILTWADKVLAESGTI